MVSAGITTVFDAISIGDIEPDSPRVRHLTEMVEALRAAVGDLRAEHKLHLRYELTYAEVVTRFETLSADPLVGLASLMDHTPDMLRKQSDAQELMTYLQRTRLSADDFRALLLRVAERQGDVEASIRRLAAVAVEAGVPQCSHDDPSPETRR